MTKVKRNLSEVNRLIKPQSANSVTISQDENELNEIGGVSSLIQCINKAIREFELIPSINRSPEQKRLEWLRDKLIKNHYDQNTYNLIALILADDDLQDTPRPQGQFNERNLKKYNEEFSKHRDRKIKDAELIPQKCIDLNRDHFAHVGGISILIKALTNTISISKASGTSGPETDLIIELRNVLVQEYYGWEAFGLLETLIL